MKIVVTLQRADGSNIRIETEKNQRKTLLELLREQKIYVDAPCGGQGTCGKCLVQYQKGAPEAKEGEKEKISPSQLQQGWRLACLSVPEGDCEVLLSPSNQEEMAVETGFAKGRHPHRNAPEPAPQGDVSCGKVGERAKGAQEAYGVALDIGTTTLAASLVCLSTKQTCQTAVSVNHQRSYGADVISRIKAANEGKAKELQKSIQTDILSLLGELCDREGIRKNQIESLVIAGNTTMCHLLLGYSCEGLGRAPFQPVAIALQEKSWEQVFGKGEYDAEITILPGISAFVGADIVAGIYSTDLGKPSGGFPTGVGIPPKECETAMLLDIGTNGEMALYANHRLFVTSTAAGPALEGGNISCGMPGVAGAISHAALFGKERMVVKTIGKKPPEGLCGTGVIDVVYELSRHRLIDENGTLQREYEETGYPVVKDRLFFTQEDIRQVQMAKAAIRAGIELLFEYAGIAIGQVSRVWIAGGFGFALDTEKAIGIGLLPEGFRGKTAGAGNSALEGAKRYLTEPNAGEKMAELAGRAEEINLAMQKEFQERYVQYMQF